MKFMLDTNMLHHYMLQWEPASSYIDALIDDGHTIILSSQAHKEMQGHRKDPRFNFTTEQLQSLDELYTCLTVLEPDPETDRITLQYIDFWHWLIKWHRSNHAHIVPPEPSEEDARIAVEAMQEEVHVLITNNVKDFYPLRFYGIPLFDPKSGKWFREIPGTPPNWDITGVLLRVPKTPKAK